MMKMTDSRVSKEESGKRDKHERLRGETFEWIVRPEGGTIRGRVYVDGPMLDGPEINMARCG